MASAPRRERRTSGSHTGQTRHLHGTASRKVPAGNRRTTTAHPGLAGTDEHSKRQKSVPRLLVDREAIEHSDAAPADKISLAATGRVVRRVPRLISVVDPIGMTHLRGACTVARPVVARVIRRVCDGAA